MVPEKYKQDYEFLNNARMSFWRHPLMHLRSFMFWGRLYEESSGRLVRRIAAFVIRQMQKRNGIEMVWNGNIGGGLLFAHGRNITINARVKMGRKCVLFKGCLLGSVRSGRREGVPVFGDKVVVGANAVVVGGVTIGTDVLIAPNAFVNFDVPDHSVVVGNPGVIHHREGATRDYIKD